MNWSLITVLRTHAPSRPIDAVTPAAPAARSPLRNRGVTRPAPAAARRSPSSGTVLQRARVSPSLLVQAGDEIDHRAADLLRALLLGPVAAAGQEPGVPQAGNGVLEAGRPAGEADDQVLLSG